MFIAFVSINNVYDVNIYGYVKIYLYRVKEDGRWGITYELLYSRLYDKKNKRKGVEVQFGNNGYIAWEDDSEDDIVDELVNKKVDIVINTTEGRQSIEDSSSIRKTALQNKIFCTTHHVSKKQLFF